MVSKKLVVPAVIAMLCGLALVAPPSDPARSSPGSPQPVGAVASSTTRSLTLGSSLTSDVGSPATGSQAATGPAPAVEPAVAPPADTAPRTAALGQAAAGSTTTSPTPPEPASIPPLSASPSDLEALAKQGPVLPGVETPRTESATAPQNLTTEALVRDDNSSQINAVFAAINSYRASLGLQAVRYQSTVAGMAQEWSDSIASREVIEHRANFWTDPRALNPNNGAGEVIAVRWDRDAAQLVQWWKNSPAHNAILTDPRFNVVGIGLTFTDGNWQTTPNRYTMWGVVDFFGYTTLPAGTTASPGATSSPGSGGTEPALPAAPASMCDPAVRHMPPTVDLSNAAIKSAGDLVSVDAAGQLLDRPSLGDRTFGSAQIIGSGFGAAKEVFVTDWQRDGVYDVLTQWADGRITLLPGLAQGGFLAPVTLGQSGWAGMTLAVGGWCANNRMPQLLALDGAGNLWLYPNRGIADLSERTQIASGVSATRLTMVDYDADGFQDLLARRSDGDVLLYRGAGTPNPRAEARPVVASGWSDVTAVRPLRDVTGLNSTGLALRRTGGSSGDIVQYWDVSSGSLSSASAIPGSWAGQKLAQ